MRKEETTEFMLLVKNHNSKWIKNRHEEKNANITV